MPGQKYPEPTNAAAASMREHPATMPLCDVQNRLKEYDDGRKSRLNNVVNDELVNEII